MDTTNETILVKCKCGDGSCMLCDDDGMIPEVASIASDAADQVTALRSALVRMSERLKMMGEDMKARVASASVRDLTEHFDRLIMLHNDATTAMLAIERHTDAMAKVRP